jgi:hypothetical protein
LPSFGLGFGLRWRIGVRVGFRGRARVGVFRKRMRGRRAVCVKQAVVAGGLVAWQAVQVAALVAVFAGQYCRWRVAHGAAT